MLNNEKYLLVMGRILKDIYTDISLSSLLGFKGGTCAYLFYGLPRFSVDLDFDLFAADEQTNESVFNKIEKILERREGGIKDKSIKRHTIFFLLSYGESDHNIKIEINTRKLVPDIKKYYNVREYMGIPILTAMRDYLFAGKLLALTDRKEVATRDVYDLWYFADNNWSISEEVIKERANKTVSQQLDDCISVIEGIKDNYLLSGLGELLVEKQKQWAKANLREETIFLLKNYQAALQK